MKRFLTPLFTFCVALAVNAQPVPATGSPVLRADNIDEVVSALTLEEKVHLVIGCGMSMGSDSKFPGTAGRTYDIPRLGIPSAFLADGPHRLAMAPNGNSTAAPITPPNSPRAPRWQLRSILMLLTM